MEIKDKRIAVARNAEQEYAHNYAGKPEDYQYPNESQRVTYHVDSDKEDDLPLESLYNINEQIQQPVATQPVNKIKARLNSDTILEDHRQRAYKVRNRAQIYDKSDPGQEIYKLQQDVRDLEVQQIQQSSTQFEAQIAEEATRDITDPRQRFAPTQDNQDIQLAEGTEVVHKEEKIKGKVAFVGSNKVAVVWNDNTRERFSLAEAKESLEVINYVDDAQQQVDPIHTTPFPKTDDKLTKEVDDIHAKALAALEADDHDDDIEDGNPNKPKFDIETAKLQRQVKNLEAQVHNNTIDKIKQQAAYELVDLMQSKGLLSTTAEAREKQTKSILAMSDSEYETLKNDVVAGKLDAADLALMNLDVEDEDDEIEDGQKFALLKEALKKSPVKSSRSSDGVEMGDTTFLENIGLSNFKGSIGDFSSQLGPKTASPSVPSSETAARSIRRTDNGTKTAAPASNGLDFSGFQNIEGLAKPINIASKEVTTGSKFSELFGSMNWTTTNSRR